VAERGGWFVTAVRILSATVLGFGPGPMLSGHREKA
jgi:hypothetical protein